MAAHTCLVEEFIQPNELAISEEGHCDLLVKLLSSWLGLVDELEVRKVSDREVVVVFN